MERPGMTVVVLQTLVLCITSHRGWVGKTAHARQAHKEMGRSGLREPTLTKAWA